MSLNNSLTKDTFNDDIFQFYISQFINDKVETIAVKQQRTKGDFKRFKITSEIENITFSNDLSTRRYVCPKSLNYTTYPYGINQ